MGRVVPSVTLRQLINSFTQNPDGRYSANLLDVRIVLDQHPNDVERSIFGVINARLTARGDEPIPTPRFWLA